MVLHWQARRKEERNVVVSLLYWLKLRCCVRRRIAILIRYTLKTPSVHYWRSHKDEISVNFHLLIPSFTESIPPFTVHEYVELSMSGSTGKRSFADIIRYWVIHNKNLYLPYLLDELRGLFVSTGLASFSSIGLGPSAKRVFYREPTRKLC